MWIGPRKSSYLSVGMIKLTKKMREVLEKADLPKGEINNVPMSTMYGLEARHLVSSDWRKISGGVRQTTSGGMFPTYNHVKLTVSGLRAARSVQGLRPDV